MKTLIQINQDYIIVDDEAEIKYNDLCYDEERQQEFTSNKQTQLYKTESNLKVYKIIASTNKEHNVPLISNIEEALEMIKDKEIKQLVDSLCEERYNKYHTGSGDTFKYEDYEEGIIDGYKSNKAEFTREQMIEAINLTRAGALSKRYYSDDEVLQLITPPIQPTNVEVEEIKVPIIVNGYKNQPKDVIGFVAETEYQTQIKITKIL